MYLKDTSYLNVPVFFTIDDRANLGEHECYSNPPYILSAVYFIRRIFYPPYILSAVNFKRLCILLSHQIQFGPLPPRGIILFPVPL